MTEATKWTAGEAVPCGLIDGDWIIFTDHPDPEMREVIEVCNASEGEARMFAASPDMAEALRKLLTLAEHSYHIGQLRDPSNADNDGWTEILEARAALAKAGVS